MKKEILKRYSSFILGIEILLFVFISLLSYHYLLKPEGKKIFYLSVHDANSLYQSLKDNNYSMYFFDKMYLPFVNIPEEGWYHIEHFNQGRFSFLDNLYLHKAPTTQILIYAGETAKEISERLAKNLDLNESKLLAHYKNLSHFGEGDLISGEYTIASESTEATAIAHLFKQSRKIRYKIQQKYSIESANNISESKIILTIASIIQKESNYAAEMPLISSVIYNRLEKDMRLQMDSTLNYGIYSHKIINSERIKNDISEYNTYKYKGLPPRPLCSISKEAYEAAYLPKSTDYFFFMLDRNGTHLFAASYKEHLVNVHKFKSEMLDTNSSNSSNSSSKNILISSAK